MKLRLALASTVLLSFTSSAAWAAKSNIEFLAGLPDAKLDLAATIAGNLLGVMKRCPALRPTEDGKAMIAVPVLLYDGRAKHLTPNPRKFDRAIHTYERAYAMAVQRGGNCQTEKAKYPKLYR
ncbi:MULTISPECIES: hypothetical protein [unclassified Mesorhizobium]|uniref:hypothetical protein n=1 Tax=unclassified Mesorhizobium TaxID=325217 RepID=UPI0015E3E7D2|nr:MULTISPECIES: hypothetical protein [unclassified Mesorhizobium]